MNISLFRISLFMQTNYDRFWIKKICQKFKKKEKFFNVNMKILISVAVTISDYKIKVKSEILTEAFDKILNENHMIYMIFSNFSNETAVD